LVFSTKPFRFFLILLSLLTAAQIGAAQNIEPTADATWTPEIAAFDGVLMARVPAGCFIMGSDSGAPNEQPAHEICFNADFWIDVYEVTHAQFAAFGGAAGRSAAFAGVGDDLPRERVTWFEAYDFCALRGARLPTEAEWEYAARGIASLIYPWGDVFTAGTAVVALGAGGHPQPIGGRERGVSWVGTHDQAGNVFEWTNSLFMPYPYNPDDGREAFGQAGISRVIRGGAWNYNGDLARASARGVRPPITETPDIGFRCARDA
jgi:formylglycine-generating enzyme required for sulfatase activity